MNINEFISENRTYIITAGIVVLYTLNHYGVLSQEGLNLAIGVLLGGVVVQKIVTKS